MRIQNFGMAIAPERELFIRVLMDLERRNLPDIGLYTTLNSGVRWNNEILETLSCKLPKEGREMHFAIVKKANEEDEKLPAVLNVLLVQTKNDGEKAEPVWHQIFPADVRKVGNISFEVARMFLQTVGLITNPRQGIELMYPAYDLQIPLNTEAPGLHGKPKAAAPLPEVPEEPDASSMRPSE
ncbi:hypothetical protein [Burkholderia phage FLC9]|nr:hypothetical protein [Burkholderia phage FLC9]